MAGAGSSRAATASERASSSRSFAETLARPLVVSPHRLAHETAVAALERFPGLPAFGYEDAIYRRISGLVTERIERLRAAGWIVERVAFGRGEACADQTCPACRLKRRAVARYRSQLRALTTRGRPRYVDALDGERYWRLVRRPSPSHRGGADRIHWERHHLDP